MFSPARLLLLALVALLAAPEADAQYFGRNQVRYSTFNYRVLETEHFEIYYYDGMEQAVRDVARMAERWYTRLSGALGHEYDGRKAILLYADDTDFRQTNIAQIGEGTQGVTEGLRQRVVLPMAATYAETDHVLGHELVHQFQYDIAQRSGRFQQFVRLPLPLIEGMAEYFSVGRQDALTAMWMRDALLRNDFPSITDLQRSGRFNEYRYGQPLWAYIGGTFGDDTAARLFRTALEMPLDSALVTVTGLSPDTLSARWEAALRAELLPATAGRSVPTPPRTAADRERIADDRRRRAEAIADGRRPRAPRVMAYPDSLARITATRLLAEERGTGAINLAPQLSPDGRYVAYLSERDLFGIDLFLADAATGEVLRTLASVGTDAHTDALRFIESAGAWRPDGQQFAYVVFARGDNEIAILDVDRRRTVRRIAFEGVGAIKDPSYSPDGRRIVFSGVRAGITDLFVVDVESREVVQLTQDRFADIQPSWSPDGRTIAFVTDRGPGTDFDRLTYAPTRLALYRLPEGAPAAGPLAALAGGTFETLSLFPGSRHINPVWSPDGADLYFLADREGFSDVYRLDMTSGEAFQVTNLATGVSGIASLSPALSVSRGTGALAYSVFEAQRYTVYTTPAAEARGVPVETGIAEARADVLPPGDALGRSRVEGYLADARAGLPEAEAEFAVRPFRSRLSLDYISQPQIGAVYDPSYGSGLGVGGGIAFFFSDQLSDKFLGVVVQANGTLQDIGAQALYLDRGRRFTYGAQVGHIPILQVFGAPDPTGTYFTRYYERTFISQAQGIVAYPLNQTQRLESQLGVSRLGFSVEYDAFSVDPRNPGIGVYDGRRRVEGFEQPALAFGTGSLAFVGDYSNFGFTSPVRGGRYRFGAETTVGSLDFTTVTVDYRRYLLLRPPGLPRRAPVTLAARATHFGRYGPGTTDSRLRPLYLGYGQYVRGYTPGSFERDEFLAFQDRLIGPRLGLATAELRLPLLGVRQLGLLSFPFLPTELVLFADAGMAWGQYSTSSGIGGGTTGGPLSGTDFSAQRPVFSTGVSARVNLLGALVLEPYAAFPLSRDRVNSLGEREWRPVFGLNLTPGW